MAVNGRSVAVVIPTRDRPAKLAQCLAAVAAARGAHDYPVYVGDSSTTQAKRDEVDAICGEHAYVTVAHHEGNNIAMARNFVTRLAREDLLVSVDDDVFMEPECIDQLLATYDAATGLRVVAGTVRWGDVWSEPQVRLWSGDTRPARSGENVDFLITAVFVYPRLLGLQLPWNETIRGADDVFVSSLWRAHGTRLIATNKARAHHHEDHNAYPTALRADLLYTVLFDALQVEHSPARAFSYETWGLAAAMKSVGVKEMPALARAWARGNRRFFADRHRLAVLATRTIDVETPANAR